MKFGISTFVTDEGIRPDVLGRALEERGFDSLFLAEHSHIPVSRTSPYPGGGDLPHIYYRTLDPFLALTAAASATENLILGTGIALLPQRDLIHTAKEVATLDYLSGGRVAFGVGVGWNREEMANHGTDPTKRGAQINEQLAALKEIWTHDEAEFHGQHVDFDPIYSWPKPVQKPHPPIYIGGESPAALDRLVEFGDAWLPRAHTSAAELGRVRGVLADRGRPDITFTVFGAGRGAEELDGYVEAGVERAAIILSTLDESATFAKLDQIAAAIERYR
ncbi:LLM class F420-dependent oxidoreductase [Rhodococcoides yunnanense]|uniref:LLM class F420-dependent oxidoreductase n=1 Tax=Rhodococcoides yunnanense TaxID=278209 RepID=UPI00093459E7|nr:LLM class F420-dependent oxidoreductase [Rhodococcus yunnanensis]